MKRLRPGQSCVVIGAGISGLLAADRLRRAGVQVTVIEKSRGVGGRMSTRRIGPAIFDHGAQFVTVRDPHFAALMRNWEREGLVSEWSRGFPAPNKPGFDGHPRFMVRGGMTAVPKLIAGQLDVRTSTHVASVTLDKGSANGYAADARWTIHLPQGERLVADGLILTPPVPQAIDLLDLGEVDLPEPQRSELLAIRYHPCLSWMTFPTSNFRLPAPGGIQFSEGILQFIADNQQKGISETACITVQTAPEFSRRNFEANEIETWAEIVNHVAEFTGPVRRASFQRWRFAQPVEVHPEPCLPVPLAAPLVLCGDAFGGPRIEGAALSGLAAARAIMDA